MLATSSTGEIKEEMLEQKVSMGHVLEKDL